MKCIPKVVKKKKKLFYCCSNFFQINFIYKRKLLNPMVNRCFIKLKFEFPSYIFRFILSLENSFRWVWLILCP